MKTKSSSIDAGSHHHPKTARAPVLSTRGKILLALGITISLISVPLLTRAERHEEGDDNGPESKIERGFAIAPVPLDLRGKNPALVGLGSYIVNAKGGPNSCHSHSANE